MSSTPDSIAAKLHAALEQGGEAYALVLDEYWSDTPADVSHEPPLPMDRLTSRADIVAERRTLNKAFYHLMPDFTYVDIYSRVVGNVIYLFCDQQGTLPDATKVRSALCSRFTITDGKITRLVLGIDPESVKPLQAAFMALSAKAESQPGS